MGQADFSYDAPAQVPDGPDRRGGPAQAGARFGLTVSVFADRAHVRATMRDDAVAAGFRIAHEAGLSALLAAEGQPLGDVVLVDCPVLDGATLAALAGLDCRAARAGTHLIVSTAIDALEDVFGCLDLSRPQILVDPARTDRVLALGRVLARLPGLRVQDLSEEDRLTLLRLTEQVGEIAARLDRITGGASSADNGSMAEARAFNFESPRPSFTAQEPGDAGDRLVRASRPPLPEARLVRRIIRQRQLRSRYFDGDLFADPAWDMLLDLTAARVEHTRVSVTSLCIASNVPPTTALRWIGQMIDGGLLERHEDETDRRRAFITLTDKSVEAMAGYFAELGRSAGRLV